MYGVAGHVASVRRLSESALRRAVLCIAARVRRTWHWVRAVVLVPDEASVSDKP
jgi:hypothetical protein